MTRLALSNGLVKPCGSSKAVNPGGDSLLPGRDYHPSILDRLGDVMFANGVVARKIRKRARDASHAIVAPRGQPEQPARGDEQPLRRVGKGGVTLEIGPSHARIRRGARGPETKTLPQAGLLHAMSDGRGGLPCLGARQVCGVHRGDLDRDIDAIEKRSRELRLVTPHLVGRAAAAGARIAEPAARAPMRCLFAT